jgi:hypothetical protein
LNTQWVEKKVYLSILIFHLSDQSDHTVSKLSADAGSLCSEV